MSNEEIILMSIYVLVLFAFLFWLVWYFLQRRKINAKVQLQNKLLGSIKGIEDLQKFAAAESGKTFLQSLNFDRSSPRGRVISSLTLGIVVGFTGLASLIIDGILDLKEPVFLVAGVLLLAVSTGYLVATFLAYKLARKWDLLDKD
mgnify:CR=1 FL=1